MMIFDFDAIEKVYDTALKEISIMTGYATLIAGFGALLYLCAKVWKQWANGGTIDFYSLLRPFAILLILINFEYIPKVIDTLTSPLVTVTKALRDSKNEEYNEKAIQLQNLRWTKKIEHLKNIYNTATKEFDGNHYKVEGTSTGIEFIDNFTGAMASGLNKGVEYVDNSTGGAATKFANISNSLAHLGTSNNQLGLLLQDVFSYLISTFCHYMCVVVASCIVVFAYLTKIILVLLGPIVFALSLFPKFDNVLIQWISRFINVCLWVPICNIIGYVMQLLTITVVVDNAIASVDDIAVQQLAVESSNNFVLIVFLFISIFLYMMVPKIADWIISGNGTGMFADAVGSAAGKVGGVAAGMIGSKIATERLGKAIGKELKKP